MENEEIKLHYCNKNNCLVDEGYCQDYCKYRKSRAIQDFEPEKCSFYFPEEQYPRARAITQTLNDIFGFKCNCCE